jgi:quinol monooxygenase YgiN
MYHHVVTFQFKPGVSEADATNLAEELKAFAATVPGLVSYACGTDMGLRENSEDFAVAAAFETTEALKTYLEHPDHHAIVAKYGPSMLAGKHSSQFQAV